MNIDKFLIENGLNFNVEKHPLTATNSTGRQIITPYFALINSQNDAILNTCKSGYTVSQNREIVEMVVNGTKKFGTKLAIVKAGAINNGKQIYIQLECEGEAKLKTTTMKQYITVIDSNDGSTGLCYIAVINSFNFIKRVIADLGTQPLLPKRLRKYPFLSKQHFLRIPNK